MVVREAKSGKEGMDKSIRLEAQYQSCKEYFRLSLAESGVGKVVGGDYKKLLTW